MELARMRGEIISRVLDLDHIDDECETFESEIDSDDREYLQAGAKVVPDDDLLVTFNIPTETCSIFIIVSDGDAALVRTVMSNLEQIELDGKNLDMNGVIAFKNSTCLRRQRGPRNNDQYRT